MTRLFSGNLPRVMPCSARFRYVSRPHLARRALPNRPQDTWVDEAQFRDAVLRAFAGSALNVALYRPMTPPPDEDVVGPGSHVLGGE